MCVYVCVHSQVLTIQCKTLLIINGLSPDITLGQNYTVNNELWDAARLAENNYLKDGA